MEIIMYLSVFVVLGVVLHFVDVKKGEALYKYLWGKVHKDPLPENKSRGFIAGRKTIERVWPALTIVVIMFFLLRILGEHDFIILVLKAVFLMFPALLAGFALGGIMKKNKAVAEKADAVFSAIDEFEKKGVDVGGITDEVVHGAEEIGQKAVDSVIDAGERFVSAVKGEHKPVHSADVPVTEAKPEPMSVSPAPTQRKISVAEAARQFTKRG